MNEQQRLLVRNTAPILREHGESLTRHFYARMFEHNPELKPIFNQGHQQSGQQQRALALAVTAYAEQIDDPSVLAPVLRLIANKHTSLGIRAEHYPIVGQHLLSSIKEVLGELATAELIAAWAAAYGQLADLLIQMEQELYNTMALRQGGWSGYRSFEVSKKVAESDEITSFYLTPLDGGETPYFLPGQYISVKVYVPKLGIMQSRQYSISHAYNSEFLRISVKREVANTTPAGMVSNQLHDTVHQGDFIELSAPYGDFFLTDEDEHSPHRLFFISAGVGITPMIAMSQAALSLKQKPEIHFIHACRHGGVHAFKHWAHAQKQEHIQFDSTIYYESPRAQDVQGRDFDYSGRLNLSDMADKLHKDTDYYLCGPIPFMQAHKEALINLGIPTAQIKMEAFGSGLF